MVVLHFCNLRHHTLPKGGVHFAEKTGLLEENQPMESAPTTGGHHDADSEDDKVSSTRIDEDDLHYKANGQSFISTLPKRLLQHELEEQKRREPEGATRLEPIVIAPQCAATGCKMASMALGMSKGTLAESPPNLFVMTYSNEDSIIANVGRHCDGNSIMLYDRGVLDHAKVSDILKEKGIDLEVPQFSVNIHTPTLVVLCGHKVDMAWLESFKVHDDLDFHSVRGTTNIPVSISTIKFLHKQRTIDGVVVDCMLIPTKDSAYGFVLRPQFLTTGEDKEWKWDDDNDMWTFREKQSEEDEEEDENQRPKRLKKFREPPAIPPSVEDTSKIFKNLDMLKVGAFLKEMVENDDYAEGLRLVMPPFRAKTVYEKEVDDTLLHAPLPPKWEASMLHGAKMDWTAKGCKAETFTVVVAKKGMSRFSSRTIICCDAPFVAGVVNAHGIIQFATYILDAPLPLDAPQPAPATST